MYGSANKLDLHAGCWRNRLGGYRARALRCPSLDCECGRRFRRFSGIAGITRVATRSDELRFDEAVACADGLRTRCLEIRRAEQLNELGCGAFLRTQHYAHVQIAARERAMLA